MQDINLSQVDLNLLVGLDALLELQSVTAAARRLSLSQSAMSHQLRRLRVMFEDTLLVAGKGGMLVTPRAEQLRRPVRRALAELGRAIRGQQGFDPRTAQRTFVIACQDAVEVLGLPPMLDLISREAPGIQVDSRPIDPSTLAGLQEGSVDVVVGDDLEERFATRFPGLRTQVISNDEGVCLLRRGHPASAPTLTLDTFFALRHVILCPPLSQVDSLELRARTLGVELDVAARVSHLMSAPFVVASSDLAVVVPQRTANHFCSLVPLVIARVPKELRMSCELVMSWHERFEEDPSNRWLREVTARLTQAFDDEHSAETCGLTPRGPGILPGTEKAKA